MLVRPRECTASGHDRRGHSLARKDQAFWSDRHTGRLAERHVQRFTGVCGSAMRERGREPDRRHRGARKCTGAR